MSISTLNCNEPAKPVKISVIVPIYNKENYLQECLNNIEAQTFFNEIEVILINDGSSDNSLEIINNFASKHNNTIVIDQENQGVSAARNNGINASRGEFVCFLDPDDYYPNKNILEKLYYAATTHGMLIAGGSFSELKNKKLITKFQHVYQKYTFKKEGVIKYINYQFDYGYHRFIYKRELLIKNNIFFPPYIRFQDPPFFVKAMITAKRFYAIPDITYCYRVGHQKINWTKERISHLLQGLTDDLQMSRENFLSDLHWLTINRLFSEYRKMVIKHYKDNDIIFLLEKFQQQIDITLLLNKQDNVFIELKNLMISKTYKIGKLIIWLPRKIKRLFKR